MKKTVSTKKKESRAKFKKTSIGTGKNSRQGKVYRGQGR
jgi:hypothetical protein